MNGSPNEDSGQSVRVLSLRGAGLLGCAEWSNSRQGRAAQATATSKLYRAADLSAIYKDSSDCVGRPAPFIPEGRASRTNSFYEVEAPGRAGTWCRAGFRVRVELQRLATVVGLSRHLVPKRPSHPGASSS